MSNISSPLSNKEKINSSLINLESMDFIGKINLRLKKNDNQSYKNVSDFLGYKLPIDSGEVMTSDESRIAWLGPDEFLIQSADQKKLEIMNGIKEILHNQFYAITDVSDYYLTIRLSGKKSFEVLSKGCPLNFKEYLTKKNTCAQSYISKATVLMDRLPDKCTIDILVRWSFAEYLWNWLADSAAEFYDN